MFRPVTKLKWLRFDCIHFLGPLSKKAFLGSVDRKITAFSTFSYDSQQKIKRKGLFLPIHKSHRLLKQRSGASKILNHRLNPFYPNSKIEIYV